jgi:hypothetical protein
MVHVDTQQARERFLSGGGSGVICVAVAQDLDSRAGEDCPVQPDVRLPHPYPDCLHRWVILKDGHRYPLGHRLGQVDRCPLDYLLGQPVDLAVVDGLLESVGEPGGPQVQAQLDVHDEGLAQLALGGQRPVAAVEDHALEQYPVLAGTFSLVRVHPTQYTAP